MIAITHPIKRLINSQYGFLSSMLVRFPYLLEEWVHEQEKEVDQLAKNVSDGDYDIYSTVYNSEISRVDSCFEEEQLFNQSMLIMVYSYYESMLLRLAKEQGIDKSRPSEIAQSCGVTLEEEYSQISKYLFDTIYPLRNQLCHNNSGTLYSKSSEDEKAKIENLKEKGEIAIDVEGRIMITNRSFIQQTLDDEYKILTKLSEICGYKTILYSYKKDET